MMDKCRFLNNDGLLFLLQQIYSDIAAARFSGNYSDLTNRPNIPAVSAVVSADSSDETAASSKAVYSFVTNAVASLTGFHAEIVSELPESGDGNVLYLMAKPTAESGNGYNEYLYINGAWELIGSTDIDLSGYVQASEMHAVTNTEITEIVNQVWS